MGRGRREFIHEGGEHPTGGVAQKGKCKFFGKGILSITFGGNGVATLTCGKGGGGALTLSGRVELQEKGENCIPAYKRGERS